MTLDEAKDKIAQKQGFQDWWDLRQNMEEIDRDTVEFYSEEVAKIYAESKWKEAVLKTMDNVRIKTLFTFDCDKPEFKP